MINKEYIKQVALSEYKNLNKMRPSTNYLELFDEHKARAKGHGSTLIGCGRNHARSIEHRKEKTQFCESM